MVKIQTIGLITLVRKEITRVFRIWRQTLVPPVISITLYFLIFGTFIGSRIRINEDFSYISFIMPGLILMSVITNSFSNVASSVFGMKFQRDLEEILVSPLYPSIILLGLISGGIVRGIIIGVIVILVSSLFATITIFNLVFIIVTFIFTAILFSLFGFLTALFAKKFDDIALIPTFILAPLTYLGGVFYSLENLSPFFQNLSRFNPVLYLVNMFRYGFLGITDVKISSAIYLLIGITVVLWFLLIWLIKRGYGLRL